MAKRFSGTTHIYKDKSGGWRWRAVHTNSNVVAESGEAYTRRHRAHLYATRYGPAGFEVVVGGKGGKR